MAKGGRRFAGNCGDLDNSGLLMEASLMRNDLLNTDRRARIEERKAHKDAQETPKAAQNRGR
jgi:hypothetical protein